jgi:hypothetical protein
MAGFTGHNASTSRQDFQELFSPDITGPNNSQLSPLKRII